MFLELYEGHLNPHSNPPNLWVSSKKFNQFYEKQNKEVFKLDYAEIFISLR